MKSREQVHKNLKGVARIGPEERDRELNLELADWGSKLQRWTPESEPHRHFSRTFKVHRNAESQLHETIVPFPSAPIYGTNRKAEYGMPLLRPNMHSLRVLRHPNTKRITRLFLLHNGLNEADDLIFYYRLADWILQEQDGDEAGPACVVMPFPGHLMHFAYHGPFSETPLDRYLNDAGDLFRQFLRYMVCVRWLLGIATSAKPKSWMVGGELPGPGFVSLGEEIHEEATTLHETSRERIERTEKMRKRQVKPEEQQDLRTGDEIERTRVDECIKLVRHAIGRSPGRRTNLPIHLIGYSLGGFIAQSIFFAWPQVVSSCTTICSGGPIASLSPTAFAHPEEWQAVLHALRPEISNSMLQGRLADESRKPEEPVEVVAGMPLQRFGYFQRIFEQVFLQEDRGSYKERLSEYSNRMLFVSGGEDPIVPPRNILDASPDEGITMLSIASMTHFLSRDPDAERPQEKEQRDFWLPEAGRLIARAAIRAERVHAAERTTAGRIKDEVVPPKGKPAVDSELLLNSEMFESALDWVLDGVTERSGWLLICRNGLPPAFLKPEHFTLWAQALHHHDVRVQQYAGGLRRRADRLDQLSQRTTLIVPRKLEHWFVHLSARFDPHSDSPSGRFTTEDERREIWDGFAGRWDESIRYFESGKLGDESEIDVDDLTESTAKWLKADRGFLEVTHLPDVWIAIGPKAESIIAKERKRQKASESIVEGIAGILADHLEREAAKKENPEVELAESVLEQDLEEKRIRVVRVSGAESDPRFRGRIEKSPAAVTRLLVRSAAGMVRSRPGGEGA